MANGGGYVDPRPTGYPDREIYENGGTVQGALAMLNRLDRRSPYIMVSHDSRGTEGHITALFFSRGNWYLYNSQQSEVEHGRRRTGAAIIPMTNMEMLTPGAHQYLVRANKTWGPSDFFHMLLRMDESRVGFLLNYMPMVRTFGEAAALDMMRTSDVLPRPFMLQAQQVREAQEREHALLAAAAAIPLTFNDSSSDPNLSDSSSDPEDENEN